MGFREGPSLILDKSAFEMLSNDEHTERMCSYRLNVLPVLIREIHTDLMSRDPNLGTTPERRVQVLAKKFGGSGDPPNVTYQELCAGSLTGRTIEMEGRPIWDGGEYFEDENGEGSVLFDVTPTGHQIMRMASGRFSENDRINAATQRLRNATLSVGALEGRLRGQPIRRPKAPADLAAIVDEMLADGAVQAKVIDWLIEQLRLPSGVHAAIRGRWLRDGAPLLKAFAPYAFFCARALLMLMVGMKHKTIPPRPTNRVDVEYLFYAPFCEVFVSQDKVHKVLAPLLLRADQTFRLGSEFKADLKERWAARKARQAI